MFYRLIYSYTFCLLGYVDKKIVFIKCTSSIDSRHGGLYSETIRRRPFSSVRNFLSTKVIFSLDALVFGGENRNTLAQQLSARPSICLLHLAVSDMHRSQSHNHMQTCGRGERYRHVRRQFWPHTPLSIHLRMLRKKIRTAI